LDQTSAKGGRYDVDLLEHDQVDTLHVEPNILAFSWLGGAGNYQQLLSAAFDEAAGHAFATEFAGATKGLQVPESLSLLRRSAGSASTTGCTSQGRRWCRPDRPPTSLSMSPMDSSSSTRSAGST
jgi:hypothetical protein